MVSARRRRIAPALEFVHTVQPSTVPMLDIVIQKPAGQRSGVLLQTDSAQQGVRVVAVDADSPLAGKLIEGDLVKGLDNTVVKYAKDLAQRLLVRSHLTLCVQRRPPPYSPCEFYPEIIDRVAMIKQTVAKMPHATTQQIIAVASETAARPTSPIA